MFNNRKYINKLRSRIEFLEKDIESKENSVCNLLEANKELAQHNYSLEKEVTYKVLYKREYENFKKAHDLARKNRNKVSVLEKVIKKHEENECRLNTELCRATDKLDKIKNAYKMLTGEEIE